MKNKHLNAKLASQKYVDIKGDHGRLNKQTKATVRMPHHKTKTGSPAQKGGHMEDTGMR